jgi:hypothetical protein
VTVICTPSEMITRRLARFLAWRIERMAGPRCQTYDLEDFPEERYTPRQTLYSRCVVCWSWDLADNLRQFAK